MKRSIQLCAVLGILFAAMACNSNEVNLTLAEIQTGANYVLTVEKAPQADFQLVASAIGEVQSVYAGYTAGTNALTDVQNAITDLENNLTGIFQAFHITDPQTQALASLTINQAAALINYVISVKSNNSPANVGVVVSSAKTTRKQYKTAFNAAAGKKVI